MAGQRGGSSSGPRTSALGVAAEDRRGAGLEEVRDVDGSGPLVDADADWGGADRLRGHGAAAAAGHPGPAPRAVDYRGGGAVLVGAVDDVGAGVHDVHAGAPAAWAGWV